MEKILFAVPFKSSRFSEGFRNLGRHALYAGLLVLLLCIALTVILIQAGSLFLVDYIPVSHSVINKIHQQELHWQGQLAHARAGTKAQAAAIVRGLDANYLDPLDPEVIWMVRRDHQNLQQGMDQVFAAENRFRHAQQQQTLPVDTRLLMAEDVVKAYRELGMALQHDIEIKQSVIALLQLMGLFFIMSCIAAIALGARRVLQDRLDRLVDFIPEKFVDGAHGATNDEFLRLEQRVFGLTARLEGYVAEATWANKTSERLRNMGRAQEFLAKLVELINQQPLTEMALRKLLHALERALDLNNAAVIFTEDETVISAERIVYSNHPPCALGNEIFEELQAAGSATFLESNVELVEVRCMAVTFAGSSGEVGVLMVETDKDRFLEDSEIEVLQITAGLLSMVAKFQSRDQEGRRVAVLEERAAIARELHDSLAQSLSYMKIQLARLQTSALNQDGGGNSLAVVSELREGLDNAYRELRELLATFRVHMDVRGLGYAIQSAIDEFSQRSSLSITLDNRLVNCRLTVNEEFHILHVVREALSNIVRHSGASTVSIALALQANGSVVVTIDDDGVGYSPATDGQDHYGHAIMKERAYSLGGNIEILARRQGGTRVRLVFTPKLAQ